MIASFPTASEPGGAVLLGVEANVGLLERGAGRSAGFAAAGSSWMHLLCEAARLGWDSHHRTTSPASPRRLPSETPTQHDATPWPTRLTEERRRVSSSRASGRPGRQGSLAAREVMSVESGKCSLISPKSRADPCRPVQPFVTGKCQPFDSHLFNQTSSNLPHDSKSCSLAPTLVCSNFKVSVTTPSHSLRLLRELCD